MSGYVEAQHSTHRVSHIRSKQTTDAIDRKAPRRTKEMRKTRQKKIVKIANDVERIARTRAHTTAKQWCKSATPTTICQKVPVLLSGGTLQPQVEWD